MILVYYLKDVAMLCFYFSFIKANSAAVANSVNFIPVILLMALGPIASKVLYARYRENTRYLGLLPIAASFLVSEITPVNILLLIPAAGYSVVLVTKKFKDLEYYSFVKLFRVLIIWGGLFTIVFTIMAFLTQWEMREHVIGTLYFAAFAIIGIIVARRLRMNTDRIRRDSFKSLIPIAVAAGVFSIIGVIYRFFSESINAGIRAALMVLFIPLGYLNEKWSELARDMGKMPIPVATGNAQAEVNMEMVGGSTLQEDMINAGFTLPFNEIILGITILILCVVLFFVIRQLSVGGRSGNRNEYESFKVVGVKKKVQKERFSNTEKVRKIYRQFLGIMQSRGVVVANNMTSEEVLLLLAQDLSYEAAVALRNVYIHARYDEYGEITDEEVALAKEAIKRLSI
ncbi:MAG: hypothetical protein K6E39_06045 [Lachnospiraceae bacterium]|nr:hypothetical protein [Lachnospiraceae bacterium]